MVRNVGKNMIPFFALNIYLTADKTTIRIHEFFYTREALQARIVDLMDGWELEHGVPWEEDPPPQPTVWEVGFWCHNLFKNALAHVAVKPIEIVDYTYEDGFTGTLTLNFGDQQFWRNEDITLPWPWQNGNYATHDNSYDTKR